MPGIDILTNCDFTATMSLEKSVEMLPNFRQPLDDGVHVAADVVWVRPVVYETTAQVATEETLHWFHVIGTKDPAEVMMKLEICGGACHVVHCSNHVRTEKHK